MKHQPWLIVASLGALVFLPRETVAAEDALAIARQRMVADQLAGPGRDITNARVLAAMAKVPRHEFVPQRLRAQAYLDCPLPIGHDQTISLQPIDPAAGRLDQCHGSNADLHQ